ncbi:MAG: type II toxin-antitoxin system HicA family toxin [Carnobacterium sp.]|nr:type II toxin-antitoxin system HicA family toxin [Carnobacterium sp.]
MPLTPKNMVKLLKKNGFTEFRQDGSHLVMVNADTRRKTIVPMHNKDLAKGTEQAILKQAGLK